MLRSPAQALVWEIWAANRRSWMAIGTVSLIWAVLFQWLGTVVQKSDAIEAACIIPAIAMLGLTMAIFNFTEVNRRKGFAGFPQRLFTVPVDTWLLVGVPMLCGIVSVVGLYVAWTELIFRPAGFKFLVRW